MRIEGVVFTGVAALEDGEVLPVGSDETVRTQFRLIYSTNRSKDSQPGN